MSRIVKMVGLLALVAAFGLANTAVASPPVPPPVEGFYVDAATIIDCFGTVTENEAFTWTYGTGMFDVTTMTMQVLDSAAQIRYEENFSAVDGSTMFNKTFAAYSHIDDVPNLGVTKDFGYVGDTASLVAELDESERVGIGIVSYGGIVEPGEIGGLESICPWAAEGDWAWYPATNEFITMGSTVKTGVNMFADTPAIVATKDTAATTTLPPDLTKDPASATALSPALSHEVTASGYGEVTASMVLHLQEGADLYSPEIQDPQLIGETRYTQNTLASGVIANFQKEMIYKTFIQPTPLDQISPP